MMKEGWVYKKLGEVCDISSARRVRQSDWKDSGVPFYRAREIVKLANDGHVENEVFISENLFNELSKSGLPKEGDLMISAVGTLGATYIVKATDRFYYKDASVICISNVKNLISEYLRYLFSSNFIIEQIQKQSQGATVGTITISNANKFIIPVPPLAEQKRIVEELDLLSGIIEKQKQQLKELDTLAQSIFYDMFGDPVTNEKGWEMQLMKEGVNEMFIGPFGSALKKDCFVSEEEGYCMVYEQKHAIQKKLEFETRYITIEKYKSLKRFEVGPGNFIMSCRGTVGELFLLPSDAPKGIIHPSLMKISIDSFIFNHIFFEWLLSTIIKYETTKGNCVQMAITAKELGNKEVIQPPLPLQNLFASKIEAIEKQRADITKSIEETQKLFDYTMDKYFG